MMHLNLIKLSTLIVSFDVPEPKPLAVNDFKPSDSDCIYRL